MANQYFIYILTNQYHTVLYTGVTNNLSRRVSQHREGGSGFSSRYRTTKLVYYEVSESVEAAIKREKQIKAGPRSRKIGLIDSMNPEWKDLAEDQ